MQRQWIWLACLLMAQAAWAQDSEETDPAATDASVGETRDVDDAASDEAPDDEDDSDVLYAEEDEDVFVPSEDVKFGQSIPFPTDI